MLEETVKDYATYFKLDLTSGIQTVQEVIDNMITRLEELTSVVKMIKMKNNDCSTSVSVDINKYKYEINLLSKKITTLTDVIAKLQNNVDILEKQVEKAEIDFGVNSDNKLKSLLKPFLKKNIPTNSIITPMEKAKITSVLDNFETTND